MVAFSKRPSFYRLFIYESIRIGPDRAYPLHFTLSQLLLQLLTFSGRKLGCNLFLLVFWALSFEMITFQPLVSFGSGNVYSITKEIVNYLIYSHHILPSIQTNKYL